MKHWYLLMTILLLVLRNFVFLAELANELHMQNLREHRGPGWRPILPCQQEMKALFPKGVPLLWAWFAGVQAADQKPCILVSTSLPRKTSQLLFLLHTHCI